MRRSLWFDLLRLWRNFLRSLFGRSFVSTFARSRSCRFGDDILSLKGRLLVLGAGGWPVLAGFFDLALPGLACAPNRVD
jgi:hypothetical protein